MMAKITFVKRTPDMTTVDWIIACKRKAKQERANHNIQPWGKQYLKRHYCFFGWLQNLQPARLSWRCLQWKSVQPTACTQTRTASKQAKQMDSLSC